MSITIANNLKHHVSTKLKRYIKAWRIVRTDNRKYFFTDNPTPVTTQVDGLDLRVTFTPGGFNSTAVQSENELVPSDAEYQGAIDSQIISDGDLRAGLFDEAIITEYILDWQFPFARPVFTHKYFIDGVQWTGESWKAEVSGLGRFLQVPIGTIYSNTCRHKLGSQVSDADAGACEVDLPAFAGTQIDRVVTTVTNRETFAATAIVTQVDDFYNFGLVKFNTGANAGLEFEIRDWTNTGRVLDLQIPVPFNITVGDEFDLEPGCDKTTLDCDGRYSNLPNFGGFIFLPGEDAIMRTP